MIRAGSPGTSWISMNAASVTTSSTISEWSARRPRYSVTCRATPPRSALPDVPEVPPAALEGVEVVHARPQPGARRDEEHRHPRGVVERQPLQLREQLPPLGLVRGRVGGQRQAPGLLALVPGPEA